MVETADLKVVGESDDLTDSGREFQNLMLLGKKE